MADTLAFYGFSEDPFRDAPNPKFYFPAESHHEALMALQYGINERKGFMLLLGAKGSGKTTLINHLISTLDEKVRIAFIHNSGIPYRKILKEILHQLDVPLKPSLKGSMLHELYYHLIRCLEQDENAAIILDEAHRIDVPVVEEVRLLANLETSTAKLLQIVLSGEANLWDKLHADAIRQIGQRIVITTRLEAMTEEESIRYIDHRLKLVGSSSAKIFTDEALQIICKEAGGNPRAVNIVCSNALALGSGLGEETISAATVRKIRKEKVVIKGETLQSRIARMQSGLTRKLLLAFVIVALAATAVYVGKDRINPLLSSIAAWRSTEHQVIEQEVNEQAALTDAPKAPIASVTLPVPPEKLEPPPPEPEKRPDTAIRVKSVVEANVGVNLSSMALKHYNSVTTTLIDHILDMNPSITNPDLILLHQQVKLPELTEALLIKPSGDGTFKVHVATFAGRSAAVQYSRGLGFKDNDIEIVPRTVSTQNTWYRVMTGPYAGWDEALGAISHLKKRGYLTLYQESQTR
jgi:general secretion pathway protein A